jgi:hypothetical protein
MRSVTQLSLFDGQGFDMASSPSIQEVLEGLETSIDVESSMEAWEWRRCAELAASLNWPALSLEPMKCWPGVEIPGNAPAWRAFLVETKNGLGLVEITLRKILHPCPFGCIDEKAGLHRLPVEPSSPSEEWKRMLMIRLAEFLHWPRVSWWDANQVATIGPGEEVWRKYQIYGAYGHVIGAVTALERRLRGEPDQVSRRWSYDEEGED